MCLRLGTRLKPLSLRWLSPPAQPNPVSVTELGTVILQWRMLDAMRSTRPPPSRQLLTTFATLRLNVVFGSPGDRGREELHDLKRPRELPAVAWRAGPLRRRFPRRVEARRHGHQMPLSSARHKRRNAAYPIAGMDWIGLFPLDAPAGWIIFFEVAPIPRR